MNSGSVEWLQAIELERDLTLSDWNKAKEMEKEQKRIKLPSHYEILDKADEEDDKGKHYAFIRGAKWMRDKIQEDNDKQ